jgi:hypothetical protein
LADRGFKHVQQDEPGTETTRQSLGVVCRTAAPVREIHRKQDRIEAERHAEYLLFGCY